MLKAFLLRQTEKSTYHICHQKLSSFMTFHGLPCLCLLHYMKSTPKAPNSAPCQKHCGVLVGDKKDCCFDIIEKGFEVKTKGLSQVVPKVGFEPTLPCGNQILSLSVLGVFATIDLVFLYISLY
jgi:hypothetical protein